MLEKDNFDSQIIYKLLNEQTLNFSPHFVLKDRQIISNEEDVKEEVRAHFQQIYTEKQPPLEGFDEIISNCPSINHLKDYVFTIEEIESTLTKKKSTAPGLTRLLMIVLNFWPNIRKNTSLLFFKFSIKTVTTWGESQLNGTRVKPSFFQKRTHIFPSIIGGLSLCFRLCTKVTQHY